MTASLALGLAPASPALAAGEQTIGLLMSGDRCPDDDVARALSAALRARRRGPIPGARISAAVALVRATRAVHAAPDLYTRTDFAGCVSLLSITEQELGRNLTSDSPAELQRAHRLLAKVNLWLGICQWAAGDPQAAAASFVRSAQLPNSPVPDGRLLPPDVLDEYDKAVSAPREEVSCSLDETLTAADLLVDGKGPTVKGRTLRMPAGTHYLVVHLPCPSDEAACRRQRRSLRLEGQPLGCRVPRPAALAPDRPETPVCVSASEGADAGFIGDVGRLAGAGGVLVATLSRGSMTLRFGVPGRDAFVRQVVTSVDEPVQATASPSDARQNRVTTVHRSIDLLLGHGTGNTSAHGLVEDDQPWYGKWWVWGVVGMAASALVVTVAAVSSATRSDRVNVVFDPR